VGVAIDYLALPKLVYLAPLELHRTPRRRDFSSGALQGAVLGRPTDELGDSEFVPGVGGSVLSLAVGKGIGPPLHKLPKALMAAKSLTGGDGSPFDVLGNHLRENPVELTVVP
jgi:hypothetical protein